MTVEEKREAIRKHCNKSTSHCETCGLGTKENCFYRATAEEIEENYNILFGSEAADERGDNNMEKQTVTIELERYEELVKKEAILDKLTAINDVNVCLTTKAESNLE